MNLVDKINQKQLKTDLPEIRVGYTVKVDVWIREGKKERIQSFEGLVVGIKGGSVSERITVRKKSGNTVIKRIFVVHSPLIDKITVVRKGVVRRAKLNFIDKMAKDYKPKEKREITTKPEPAKTTKPKETKKTEEAA